MSKQFDFGFIVEQALGHKTHGQNLHNNIAQDETIAAQWGFPIFETSGWGSKIPVYKSNWTVRAGFQARRMVAHMQQKAPLDALFFHTQVTAVLATNWVKQIPSIVSLDATPRQYDELGEFYNHQSGPGWLERQKWQLNYNCLHAARHLIAWTSWTKQGLIDDYNLPSDKITVIPPGVNPDEWKRPKPRQLHDGPIKILFVGGNLARKGGELLLGAFRKLRQEKAVELHLVTRDTVPSEPGVFVYNNIQPNSDVLKQLYFDCDIFCLPTYGDCLPMVLSEAGAAGLPLVSTNVAGIPEIVQDGHNGFLIPPGSQDALYDALLKLVRLPNLRLHMGETAVSRITNHFDAQKNAQLLIDLMKQIAKPIVTGFELQVTP